MRLTVGTDIPVVVLWFMKPDVIRLPQKFKVAEVVVGLVAVEVMNNLALREEPTQVALHDETMLVDVAPPVSGGVTVAEFKDVAALASDATLPVGIADTLLERR